MKNINSIFLNIFKLAPLLILIIIISGCDLIVKPISVSPIVPPRGYLYHHNRAPLILPSETVENAGNYHEPQKMLGVKMPEQIVYVKIPIPRSYVLDMSFKKADLETALRQAGIKTLLYADYEYLDILGYYRNFTIHAYGYK